MKIYDCFQFFNEIDLLEIRLELLNDVVDYFVIVETDSTHSNLPKEYNFEKNVQFFQKFLNKIIYVKESFPIDIFSFTKRDESSKYNLIYNEIMEIFESEDEGGLKQHPTFARDYLQREFIKLGLLSAEDEDIILVSDLDELPNPEIIKKIRNENLINRCVAMDCHNFFVNNICHTNWYGTYSTDFNSIKKTSLTHLRNERVNFEKFFDSGWHLSFVGGKERIKTKIQSYSHQEYNYEHLLDSLQDRINTNTDLFGRKNYSYQDPNQKYFFENMVSVDIDQYTYPKKIVNLIKNKFPYLIKEYK